MTIRDYTSYSETEILSLYSAVGWTAYTSDPDSLKRGFENSLLTLAAYVGGALIGLIRAVGDGATAVLIQDILVHPAHQRRGVGSALVKELLARFGNVRQIQLVTDNTEKTVAFYNSLGFKELDALGCRGFSSSLPFRYPGREWVHPGYPYFLRLRMHGPV